MTDGAVFITMASWEERFILGSRRLFEQHRPSPCNSLLRG